jgi:virginiamycin A acetyltransferase
VIRDDVWIGANCALSDGTMIGTGCVIGTSSLVCGTLPSYCLARGRPAVAEVGAGGNGKFTRCG